MSQQIKFRKFAIKDSLIETSEYSRGISSKKLCKLNLAKEGN